MIVRLTGGLGNQLFQYAFGQSLSKQRHEEVKYCWCRSTWDYALNEFDIDVPLVSTPCGPVYDEKTFAFDAGVYDAAPNSYYIGYWQTERYFVEPNELRKKIKLKTIRPEVQELAKRLSGEGFTFIHVRRGDYLFPGTAAYHGNLGHASLVEGYYKTAIEYMSEIKYFNPVVFSDDPMWCKQNLPFSVITGFAAYEDLHLMSSCKHSIGANSTFSWWGAWLGDYPGRINVFPKKWFNAKADTKDVIPSRWVQL